MADTIKALAAIKEFFGFRAPEYRAVDAESGAAMSGIRDFAFELKALSDAEKDELAQGAAQALGKVLVA